MSAGAVLIGNGTPLDSEDMQGHGEGHCRLPRVMTVQKRVSGLLVGVLVGGLRVLVPLLAVLLRRRRVRLRLVVLAHLVVVGCLQVVVGGRRVVRRRLVMALVGRVLARRGHVGPTFRYCGRAPGAPWPA